MKFYEVVAKKDKKSTTKIYSEYTHPSPQVNEMNLYNRAVSYFKKTKESGEYDSVLLIEVDTITYKKQILHIYEK